MREEFNDFCQLRTSRFEREHGRWPNPTEATQILEDSLKQAKATALKYRGKPKERTAITGGNGSSGNNRQQPMTEYEQFKADVEAAQNRN